MRCKREWYLTHYRKLSPKRTNPASALRTGGRVHDALEAIYTPGEYSPDAAMEALNAAIQRDMRTYKEECEKQGFPPSEEDLKAMEKANELERIMVEGYLEWLEETGADVGLQVIAPEQKISVDGEKLGYKPGLLDLMGKLDVRVLREQDNRVLFIDHKTVQSFSGPQLGLPADMQMKTYHLLELWSRLGEDPEPGGAIYNMLRKVKRTAKAVPPFYKRDEVWHNPTELRMHAERLRGIIDDILWTQELLDEGQPHQYVAYAHPTSDCHWRCKFYTVCGTFEDGSRAEEMLQEHYQEYNPLERYDETTEKEGE